MHVACFSLLQPIRECRPIGYANRPACQQASRWGRQIMGAGTDENGPKVPASIYEHGAR